MHVLNRQAIERLYLLFPGSFTSIPGGAGVAIKRNELDEQKLWELYLSCSPEKLNLSDRGYVSGLHPMELWLASYLQAHPNATWQQVLDASGDVRHSQVGGQPGRLGSLPSAGWP